MKLIEPQPLRVKLVALVLLLLVLALLLIGVASNLAINRYLTDQVDQDLRRAANQLQTTLPELIVDADLERNPTLPSNFIVLLPDRGDRIAWSGMDPEGLPKVPNVEEAARDFAHPATVWSGNGQQRWRALASRSQLGELFVVAESLSEVDGLKNRVFWTTILGGSAVFILASSLGTELVRRALRPLKTIEKIAADIANGNLASRVPDPEAGDPEPQTEVGSLARSLNTMLAQIEHAFTAQGASEAAARMSEARARRSEEKMRQFVADASHELRTPLTTIRGFAELYRHGAMGTPEEAASLVKRIEDEARRMGLLVEDLLLLARMDQERPLNPGPVELRVLAVDAIQAARVMAPDRTIELSTAPDAGDLVVRGDDARLRQVINNLMGNALAHTPAGSPVELRLAREGRFAVLEVVDHGPGLVAEQRDRVFERFYRADSARTRRADGHASTGLGLAIVAALVAAHEGTVEVESEPGQGATFRVRLPLTEDAEDIEEAEDIDQPD